MDTTQAIDRLCGVPKKRGGLCERQAGWGTPYTTGPCRIHGGTLPNVRKHHARLAALSLVAGQMGAEVDIDPLEAPLIALRIAFGTVRAWQTRIHGCDGKSDPIMDEGLRIATLDFARIAKIAVDAGVSERQIRIMERTSEELSLLFEEMAAAASATPGQRDAMRDVFVRNVERWEQPAIEGSAEDVAA